MNRQQGLTLVELLLALAISAAVTMVTVASYVAIARGSMTNTVSMQASLDVGRAVLSIERDLLQAQTHNLGVETSKDVTAVPGYVELYWTNFVVSFPEGEEPVVGGVDHVVQYTLVGTELRRFYDSDVDYSIIGRHISSVSFTDTLTGGVPGVDVALTSTVAGATEEYVLTTKQRGGGVN